MKIYDVLGRTRDVSGQIYEDGSYNCPFCWSAVSGSRAHEGCPNPACTANPSYPAARAKEELERYEARKAEEAQREKDRQWREQYRTEHERELTEGRRALIAECNASGFCVRCATKYYPYRIKRIRHRKECPIQ